MIGAARQLIPMKLSGRVKFRGTQVPWDLWTAERLYKAFEFLRKCKFPIFDDHELWKMIISHRGAIVVPHGKRQVLNEQSKLIPENTVIIYLQNSPTTLVT